MHEDIFRSRLLEAEALGVEVEGLWRELLNAHDIDAMFGGIFLAWGVFFLYLVYSTPLQELIDLVLQFIGIDISPFIWVALLIGAILGGIGGLIGAFTTQMIIGDRYKKRGKKKGRDLKPVTNDADQERIKEHLIEKPAD